MFFDCKCKSLNILGENIKTQQKETEQQKHKNSKDNRKTNRNTGYPALDPTANKYISGSGWENCCFYIISLCCVYVFLLVFMFVLMLLYVLFRLQMQKLKKTRRTHNKQHKINITTTYKLKEQHKNNRNTRYPAHEPPRINRTKLFAEVRGLDILYFYCSYVFL